MEFIQIEVKERPERGTAAVRRLRRAGWVPAVLYGLDRRNLSLSIPLVELERFVRSGSHLVELRMGEETREAILREVQQDPIDDAILHVDLQRVEKGAEVEDHVHVVFKGEAPGTKEGGLFQVLLDRIGVRARPRDLPREVLIDVAHLHVGDAVYIKDVKVPDGVTLTDAAEEMVAHVVAMRGTEGEGEGEGGEPGPTEPELVGRGGSGASDDED